ncbi:hypothetical protein GCK32_022658 [Trichostrongylus colubriformis]|uniref:Uncharacterized protein n=1 Tax=Trichostrongylus colubriformis TaxID=6319 RepID=A0AAN8IES5_TRICO
MSNRYHLRHITSPSSYASVTTNQSLLPLLGVFKLDPCLVPAAVGMAGIPIRFVGTTVITIQVGSFALDHKVHFTEADCIRRAADSYNIILGNDFLQRLPHWLLNYEQRVLLIGNDTVPILTQGPQVSNVGDARKDNSFAVRAASTVVLPPTSETFVPCQVAEAGSRVATIVTEGSVIAGDNIMVAPAVTKAGEPHLLLSNPTASPQVIYKNQYLTAARPALELANGTLLDADQWFQHITR